MFQTGVNVSGRYRKWPVFSRPLMAGFGRPPRGDAALLFPSPQAGAGSLSAATVAGVMKSAGLAGAGSPHGWRSTFRTWASERADADYAVMETSLSHAVGSAVERSYSRSTFLDKRRALLDAWSEFLAGNVAVIAEGGLSLASERSSVR